MDSSRLSPHLSFLFNRALIHVMFSLSTRTSWQKEPTKVGLTNMHEAIRPYPLVESRFFEDIFSLCRAQTHYFVEMGLLQVVGEEQKPLDPDFWILIWAKDFKDRIFQILIERHPDSKGKGIIAAVGPQDLLEFFSSMKKNAILPTLTLITSPEKMKSVAIIVSRPKSYTEKAKDKQNFQALGRFQNWIDELKQTPNVKGQWFPSNAPICPVCGNPIVGIADSYNIGYGFLVCPDCGHMERKMIPLRKKI